MKYVFDNNSLTSIFKFYYFESFPSFWDKFNRLVISGDIVSVREVRRELEAMNRWNYIKNWASDHPNFFESPSKEEMEFITEIYKIRHFQLNIEKKILLKGSPIADPFIIAKAKTNSAIVVTEEKFKENASKIPNICKRFDIEYFDLEGFLIKEDWKF